MKGHERERGGKKIKMKTKKGGEIEERLEKREDLVQKDSLKKEGKIAGVEGNRNEMSKIRRKSRRGGGMEEMRMEGRNSRKPG